MVLRVEVQIFDTSGENEEEIAEITLFDGLTNYDIIDIINPKLTPKMIAEINSLYNGISDVLKKY